MPPTFLTSLPEYKSFMERQASEIQLSQRLALASYDSFAHTHPRWVSSHDARLAYFAGIANHCNTAVAMNVALADCLSSSDWHKKRVMSGTIPDLNILLTESDKALRKNLFLQAWGLTENSIRRLRTALAGVAPTGAIFPHCEALYRTDLADPRAAEYLDLIRLVTRTRNTSHNDFSYYPDRGGDSLLHYKGQTYEFKIGVQLVFFTWGFIHERMRDLIKLFEQTVQHKKVLALHHVPR